jgi:hypothetical protein
MVMSRFDLINREQSQPHRSRRPKDLVVYRHSRQCLSAAGKPEVTEERDHDDFRARNLAKAQLRHPAQAQLTASAASAGVATALSRFRRRAGASADRGRNRPWHLFLTILLALPASALALNDTGITWSGDATSGNAGTCDPGDPAGQDCRYGADAAANAGVLYKKGGGNGGFDFTKVCNSGELAGEGSCPANDDASMASIGSGPNQWGCTKDNVTGLIWEVKTDDGGLRDKDWKYTWYDSDSPDGETGTLGSNTSCGGTLSAYSDQCNTEHYVAAVNAANICGETTENDWRMPTIKELEGIADLGRTNPGIDNPTIDSKYFPNTDFVFWSGSPYVKAGDSAWSMRFYYGDARRLTHSNPAKVQLVRDGH